MGRIEALQCPRCAWRSTSWKTFRCGRCDTVLEARVDLAGVDRDEIHRRRDNTLWRWFEFFPVEERSNIVSLGEGCTPILHAVRLGEALDIPRLRIKNDTVLPTGSLKDRSNAVGVSRACELGFSTVAVVSTGNAAASVAAYAAAAGLKSIVMVPEGTAPSKILQAAAYGAIVTVVEGTFDDVVPLYRKAVTEFEWYDCLSSNPYRNEGKKSYAYEMLDQLDGELSDWVVLPTAGGAGVSALWKGANELRDLGWTQKLPRVVAAQSAAAAPIVRAFEKGLKDTEPVAATPTVAESIQVGNSSALGARTLAALRASNGTAVALTDEEILEGQSMLASLAGIFAEPAGAISVAAAKKLRAARVIGKNESIVCNITGNGLKQPAAVRIPEAALKPIVPTLDALKRRVDSA